MTSETLPFRQTRFFGLLDDVRSGSPRLWLNSALLFAGFLVCLALPLVDDRLFNGINVWHKPAKFFLSLVVHFATVSWALSLVDHTLRTRNVTRWTINAMVISAWTEMAYICFRAARAEGSHYNTDQPLEAAIYALMGIGAVTLTAGAALIGYLIWRQRGGDIWREATGLGLMLGALLGTGTAAVLSAGTSHWIGGEMTDANGLPLFYWSTTGGDLRVAHFVGLHAMQIVPLAALSGRRSVVNGVALAISALTLFVFVQALMGLPLFRM